MRTARGQPGGRGSQRRALTAEPINTFSIAHPLKKCNCLDRELSDPATGEMAILGPHDVIGVMGYEVTGPFEVSWLQPALHTLYAGAPTTGA